MASQPCMRGGLRNVGQSARDGCGRRAQRPLGWSADGSATDAGETEPNAADQAVPMDEDALLQQALAMSMQACLNASPCMLCLPG